MQSIHLSEARRLLALKNHVKITVLTSKGEIQTHDNARPLQADFYAGTRNIKLPNGEIRRIRDTLILAINDIEVFI